MGRAMVVTGAFATHTTKLYNYCVCRSGLAAEELQNINMNFYGQKRNVGEIPR